MSEIKSHLPTMTSKAVTVLEKKFPELAREHCPSRQGVFCEESGQRCELDSCPKMKGELEKYKQ